MVNLYILVDTVVFKGAPILREDFDKVLNGGFPSHLRLTGTRPLENREFISKSLQELPL